MKPHAPHLAVVASANDAFRAWLVHVLKARGFEVSVTSSGEDAVGWALARPPQILFVGAMLDDILGFEVIERLRMTESCASARMVLIGAIYRAYRFHASPKNLYGADAYIEEGIVEEDLDSVLRELLEVRPSAATAPPPTPAPQAELLAEGAGVLEEARTLVRIIISDIYIYQPIRARRSILRNRFEEAFADDLRIGRAYFEKRIPADVLGGRDVFRETLDEFLVLKKKEYESAGLSA